MKVNAVSTLLVTFNVLFRVNEAGLRTKATPLIGMDVRLLKKTSSFHQPLVRT
jgi:hypothetical protein